MKTFTQPYMKCLSTVVRKSLPAFFLLACLPGFTQTLTAEFVAAGYTLTDLGSIEQLPSQYGGLTIRPEQPNTLYIGGNANNSSGALYSVALNRDPQSKHIIGFAGVAILYTEAPNNDGGILFDQNGTLLFTMYSMNQLGQKQFNNPYFTTSLTDYGVASSVGALAFVPAGYPGAGGLIFSSYNAGILYNVPYTVDATGKYFLSNAVAQVTVYPEASGPEGIAYIPAGSAAFPNLSMAISSYGNGTVVVYEVGEYGLPVPSTVRQMITGLTGAEGALIDPLTGDFLFSTFGGGNKVIRISGFEKPSSVFDRPKENRVAFSIFPNPTDGNVKLDFIKPVSGGLVSVFNIHGAKVAEQELSNESQYELDLSSLPAGMYFVRAEYGNSSGYQKVILK